MKKTKDSVDGCDCCDGQMGIKRYFIGIADKMPSRRPLFHDRDLCRECWLTLVSALPSLARSTKAKHDEKRRRVSLARATLKA